MNAKYTKSTTLKLKHNREKYFTEFSNCRTFNVRLHESRNISLIASLSFRFVSSYFLSSFFGRVIFSHYSNVPILVLCLSIVAPPSLPIYYIYIHIFSSLPCGSSGSLITASLPTHHFRAMAFNLNFDYKIPTFNMVILLTKFLSKIKW